MSEISADLIIENATQLLTLNTSKNRPVLRPVKEDLGIIEDGFIAIDETGKIIATGKTGERDISLKPGGTRISARGKVVMPGFVDPHSHIIFGGSRIEEVKMRLAGKTYLEIQEAGGGINFTVSATRKASEEELLDRAGHIVSSMLRHGTTTLETKSGYGLNKEVELKTLRIIKELNEKHRMDIVSTFLGAHLVPKEFLNNRQDYIKLLIEEMMPAVEGLAEFCDVFCEKGAFSVDEAREILLAGKACGLLPRIHAEQLSCLGGAELAGEIKALSADHLEYISNEGIASMAENGVVAVLLPGATFFLNLEKYPPARKMIEEGVPVALATDYNAGSCWTYSMQMIMSLACIKMKMTPEEAIIASTVNSACALKMDHIVGSLETGKYGDIIICNVPDYSLLPFYFGTNQVVTVIKKGKIVKGES
jgi:imidazolonepropionase